MAGARMIDLKLDPEILAYFVEEVIDFLESLGGVTEVSRVRDRIKGLADSCQLVGAVAIYEMASATLADIADAKGIDQRVVKAVSKLTDEVAWEAREASPRVGVRFTGGAVELKVEAVGKPWWKT